MLKLTLMDSTFEFQCEDHEREKLIEAATMLEDRLEQLPMMKDKNRVLMAALNICFDYLTMKEDTLSYTERLENQIQQMMAQIAVESNDENATETAQ